MNRSHDAFEEFLSPDEEVEHASPGTVVDDSDTMDGTIAVTDRRVLFLPRAGGRLEFHHAYVSSMRSRPRSSYTGRGLRTVSLVVAGIALAALGVLGVLASTGSGLAVALTVVGAASLAAVAIVRRDRLDVDTRGLRAALRTGSIEDVVQRRAHDGYAFGSHHGHLLLGFSLVGVVAFVSLAAFAGGPVALGFALVVAGGLLATDRGVREKRDLERSGASRRREQEVSVHLADGRLVRLRIDGDDRLDRELSRQIGTATARGGSEERDGTDSRPGAMSGPTPSAGRSTRGGRSPHGGRSTHAEGHDANRGW